MSYNRHQPHVFQQRQRWTGRCVACGLPTEHPVHQLALPLTTAPPVFRHAYDDCQPTPEPEGPEPEPLYWSRQISLF